jgi:hypothetical protein
VKQSACRCYLYSNGCPVILTTNFLATATVVKNSDTLTTGKFSRQAMLRNNIRGRSSPVSGVEVTVEYLQYHFPLVGLFEHNMLA